MRPKIFIPILILGLAILAVIFWRRSNPAMVNSELTTESVVSSNLSVGESNNGNANISASVPPVTPMPPVENPVVNDHQKTNEIRQYMESLNVPIKFYGKIIDQDGYPLAGVSIKGVVLHIKVVVPAPFGDEDQIIPIDQKTDLEGRFLIQGVAGRSLQIESIQADGYEVEPDNCPHSFGPSIGVYESPVIFKMWNTNIHEQLITGGNKFQIVPDGKPYFIDLTKGEISQTEGGDLRVWIKYPEQTERGKLYDWSCEIDVINGGLQQGDSYSMFTAPADGYMPTFQLQQQIKGGQRGSIGDKKFYVMLNNGKKFGRIQIDLVAPFNNGIPALIRLSYVINPSGSRTLR